MAGESFVKNINGIFFLVRSHFVSICASQTKNWHCPTCVNQDYLIVACADLDASQESLILPIVPILPILLQTKKPRGLSPALRYSSPLFVGTGPVPVRVSGYHSLAGPVPRATKKMHPDTRSARACPSHVPQPRDTLRSSRTLGPCYS